MKTLNKVILVISFLLLTVNYSLLTANAAVPHLINYQGRLTDSSGIPLNGSYSLTFRIYDAETAGTLLWEETHSGALIQKGIFSVLLGSVTNLNLAFDKPYFLEIKVGNEVMSPRQRITSSGYAFMAENTLSIPRGVIVMWSGRIADIPSGWALCDGINGTPDLRDRFIVGARQDDSGTAKTNVTGALTKAGGSTNITVDNLPSHTHAAGTLITSNVGAHNHSLGNVGGGWSEADTGGLLSGAGPSSPGYTGSEGTHSHTISGSTGAIGSGTTYAPPYYTLAYIIKL